MEPKLRILHIEDQPADSEMVGDLLRRGGFDPQIDRVETFNEFAAALEQGDYSLILSDYSLPRADPLEALRFARQQHPALPFIFISSTLGEEAAIDMLKQGATDYVLKQRIGRLVPAIRRALQEAEEHARQKQTEEALRSSEGVGMNTDITGRKQAEEALRQSELRLNALATATNDVVYRMNPDWTEMLDLRGRNVIADTNAPDRNWFSKYIPREDQPRVIAAIQQAIGAKSVFRLEHRVLRTDGTLGWAFSRAVPLMRDDGEISEWFGVSGDITDRKRAELAAVEYKRKLDAGILAGEVAIFEWDHAQQRFWGNSNFARFLGITPDQLDNFSLPDLLAAIHPDDRQNVSERIQLTIESGAPYEVEHRIIARHQTRWVIARGTRQLGEAGRPTRFPGILVDITEQKRAQEALRQSEERYRNLFDSIDEGFCTVEVLFDQSGRPIDHRFLQVNPAFDRQTRGAFALGKTARECVPDHEQRWFDLFGSVALTGQPTRFEDCVASSGTWFAGYAFRVGSPEQHQVGILFTDITARKQSEEALRLAVQRFETLANMIPQIVWSTRPDGYHDYCNDRWYEFFSAPKGQSSGFDWTKYIHPDDVPASLQAWQHSLATGQSYEVQYRLRRGSDGAYPWFIARAEPIRDSQGNISRWFGTCTEITELLETQQALHRRNQHLQMLRQASSRLLAGQHPVDLLGELRTQLAQTFGADVFILYETEQFADRLRLRACSGVSEDQQQTLETMRYGRAVSAKPDEALHPIVATHIQDRDAPNRRFVRKLGFRSYLYYPLIHRNHIHGTVAFASHTRDDYDPTDLDFFHTIAGTLAEALERERLESEIRQHSENLQRLVAERTAKLEETVGELEAFSYSLIHDMRAPLRAIEGYVSMIEDDSESGLKPRSRDFLARVKDAATRMDQLITDSFNYTLVLRQELPMEPVDAGDLLRGIVETYPSLQPRIADVAIEISHLVVHANKAALTQVFSNLLGNAVKFVAPGVRPHVRVWAEESTDSNDQNGPRRTLIWVEDNGIGIPKEAHNKIFGMFQRLHRTNEYPGTGVGLAIVRKSLERMGGKVCFDSELGKGTRFCVELESMPEGKTPPTGLTHEPEPAFSK